MKNILCTILVFLAFFGPCAAADDKGQPLVIGLAGPMSGPRASFGAQMREAAEIAADRINAEGGILGRRAVLEIEDDANEPKQAVTVANRLVGNGVRHVIGHWGAGMTLVASEIYAQNDVWMMTPASIASEITARGHRLVFRTVGTDRQLAAKIGEYLTGHYAPADRILIVTDVSAPATQNVSAAIDRLLREAGFGDIVREDYLAGEKDFSALATKIKSLDPGVIYCSCYHIEAGLMLRTLRGTGVMQPMVGLNMFSAPELWEIAGAAGEGTVFVSDRKFAQNEPARQLIAALAARKIEPQTYHFYTYASFQVLRQAAEAAQSLDPLKIADVIHRGRAFDTVIGPVSYTGNGDLQEAKYVFYIRKNGRVEPLAP